MRQEYLHGLIFCVSFVWTISSFFLLPVDQSLPGYRAVWMKYICVQLKYRLTLKETRIKLSISGRGPSTGKRGCREWIHNKQPIEIVVCLFIDEEKRCVRWQHFVAAVLMAPSSIYDSLKVHNSDNGSLLATAAFRTELVKMFIWLAVCTFLQVVSLNFLPRWDIELLSTRGLRRTRPGVCTEWKYQWSEHEEVPADTKRFRILEQPATETTVCSTIWVSPN